MELTTNLEQIPEDFDPLEEMKKIRKAQEEQYQAQAKLQADKQAAKFLRKNKREIARLNRHVELALYNNNYVAYSYAIKKLRGFYKQPYTEELIKLNFRTTRATLLKLAKDLTTP